MPDVDVWHTELVSVSSTWVMTSVTEDLFRNHRWNMAILNLPVLPWGQISVMFTMIMICTPIGLHSSVEEGPQFDEETVPVIEPAVGLVAGVLCVVKGLGIDGEDVGGRLDLEECNRVVQEPGIDSDIETVEARVDGPVSEVLSEPDGADEDFETDTLETLPEILPDVDVGIDMDQDSDLDNSGHFVVITVVSSVVLTVLSIIGVERGGVSPEEACEDSLDKVPDGVTAVAVHGSDEIVPGIIEPEPGVESVDRLLIWRLVKSGIVGLISVEPV